MSVRQIPVRNAETGATATAPESALPHLAGWVRTDQPDTAAPSDTPTEAEAQTAPEAETESAPTGAAKKKVNRG